jgi:N-methylhydantoinase B
MTFALDAVAYEVVRNRLVAISDEMRVALQSVSGSPTVVEASDFFTGLFKPDGSYMAMGYQGTFASVPLSRLIRWLLADKDTTIRSGDMFLNSDPWIGALHQNDVEMVCPIFHGDALVGWAGVMAHETDVGGMDFASWCPRAREVQQEGLLIPAVKLVERGEIREDVLRMVLAASRLPAALGLDLRAFTATLHVAIDRVGQLVDRYGDDRFQAATSRMMDATQRRLAERLLEMPDGVFRGRDFLEHDGHTDALYVIDLVMTKTGDRLQLDFTGSSDQAPGFVNCTEPGLHGAVAGTVLPTLCWDLAWNEGAMRNIEVVSRPGTIVTAQHPTPVGAATVSAVWVTSSVVTQALNKLLAASAAYRHRAQGVSCGTMATLNLGGMDRSGRFFGFHSLDSLACGSGAYVSRDGIDAGGPYHGPQPSISDVERNEEVTPMRTLYRRLAPDTSGDGRRRGGASAETAFALGLDTVNALIMTHGLEVPNATGALGGAPGSQVRQRIGRHALNGAPYRSLAPGEDAAALGGDWEELGPKPGMVPVGRDDVIALRWQGGGGVGDPLAREPWRVATDVADGLLSSRTARDTYGVVLDGDGEADAAATAAARRQIRTARIGAEPLDPVPLPVDAEVMAFSDAIALVVTDGEVSLRCGGHVLVRGSTRWRDAAVRGPFSMPPGNPALHPELEMSATYCPHTATLLAVDVHLKGTIPEDDAVLDLQSVLALGPRRSAPAG